MAFLVFGEVLGRREMHCDGGIIVGDFSLLWRTGGRVGRRKGDGGGGRRVQDVRR